MQNKNHTTAAAIEKNQKANLALCRLVSLIVAALGFILQFLIEPTFENLGITSLAIMTFLMASFLLLRPYALYNGKSFTGLVVLLIVSANSIIPVLGTAMELNPSIYELTSPTDVFFQRLMFSVTLIATHFIAGVATTNKKNGFVGRALDRLSVRTRFGQREIIIASHFTIGIFVLRLIMPPNLVVPRKILDAAAFLTVIPFLLLTPPFHRHTIRSPGVMIFLAVVCLFQIAAGITSRMSLVLPLVTVTVGWLSAILRGDVVIGRKMMRSLALIVFLALPIASQLRQLSRAIIIERAHRSERNLVENLSATLATYIDAERLNNAYDSGRNLRRGSWRENYVANPFVSRVTSIKYDDNCLQRLKVMSDADRSQVIQITKDKLTCQLPKPALRLIGINVDKDFVNSFSMGDLFDLLGGKHGFLGGFKTGSLVAHAYLCFGWFYPMIMIGIIVPWFILLQYVSESQISSNLVTSSTLGLLLIFPVFISLSFEGIHEVVSDATRGFVQSIIAFALLTVAVRSTNASIRKRRQDRE